VRATGRGPALDELERELPNLRAAFGHATGDQALRLAAALEPYWIATSRQHEGVEMLDAALAHGSSGRARVARSNLLRAIDMDESVRDADTGLELCAAAGDLEGQCMALDLVAALAAYFGDGERARAAAAEERALAERLGDPYHVALGGVGQGGGGRGGRVGGERGGRGGGRVRRARGWR